MRSQLSRFHLLDPTPKVKSLSSKNVGLPALKSQICGPFGVSFFCLALCPPSRNPLSPLHSLQSQLPACPLHSCCLLPARLVASDGWAGRLPVILSHLTSTGSHSLSQPCHLEHCQTSEKGPPNSWERPKTHFTIIIISYWLLLLLLFIGATNKWLYNPERGETTYIIKSLKVTFLEPALWPSPISVTPGPGQRSFFCSR